MVTFVSGIGNLYSERGLARHHVAVWLAADVTTVTIEYAHQPLAQYSAIPDAKQQRFKEGGSGVNPSDRTTDNPQSMVG